jgi:hypothetical protein
MAKGNIRRKMILRYFTRFLAVELLILHRLFE